MDEISSLRQSESRAVVHFFSALAHYFCPTGHNKNAHGHHKGARGRKSRAKMPIGQHTIIEGSDSFVKRQNIFGQKSKIPWHEVKIRTFLHFAQVHIIQTSKVKTQFCPSALYYAQVCLRTLPEESLQVGSWSKTTSATEHDMPSYSSPCSA